MKFADKYEILEMVTSGRVSTFLARERASQEAVVVYTFECAGTGASELSTASIISRFCALAPNPPGIIVKAGFDELSSSAFITTKMPEAVALKAWVGAYQSFAKPGTSPGVAPSSGDAAKLAKGPAGDETAELSAEELRAFLAKSGPSKPPPIENASEDIGGVTAAFSLDTPAPAAPQSGGEFTRLFQQANTFEPVQNKRPPISPPAARPSDATDAIFGEVLGGSPLGGHKPAAPARGTPVPAEPAPGVFTREFMGLPAEQPTPAAEAWTPEPAKKEPGAFTREFMAVSQQEFQKSDPPARPTPPPQRPVASPPQATSFESIFGPSSPPASGGGQAENQKSGAGEFTSFFRDPFESPGAPDKPIVVPDVAHSSPTKPPVGDFTRMFGRDEISGMKQSSPTPPPEPEPPQAAGSFTQMFGQSPSGKKTQGSQPGQPAVGTNANVRAPFLEPSGVPAAPPEVPRRSTPVPSAPADSIFSRTPSMAPPVNQPFMTRPGSNEATDMFRVAEGAAPPPVEPAPSGPSEFTVFLSRGQVNAAMAAAPPAPGGPAMPAPTFAPPAAPQPPPFQFTPPPAPAPPTPPAMRVPTAPAVPAVPAAPAPATPPKASGFWPLIVVLTVLLALGAVLVMYFVLKH